MSIATIGVIWLWLFYTQKFMKTVTYKAWGISHKAVKVATCTSNGVYKTMLILRRKENENAI